MTKLIYCATPSRLLKSVDNCIEKVMDVVTAEGYAPLHPFQALPYERFEGNSRVGRDKSMEFCMRLVDVSDELWMFGISSGTLMEAVHALDIKKPVEFKFEYFDPEWKKFYEELGPKYGNPLDGLLEQAKLL